MLFNLGKIRVSITSIEMIHIYYESWRSIATTLRMLTSSFYRIFWFRKAFFRILTSSFKQVLWLDPSCNQFSYHSRDMVGIFINFYQFLTNTVRSDSVLLAKENELSFNDHFAARMFSARESIGSYVLHNDPSRFLLFLSLWKCNPYTFVTYRLGHTKNIRMILYFILGYSIYIDISSTKIIVHL